MVDITIFFQKFLQIINTYSWFILITYISNASLLIFVSIAKKFKWKHFLIPLDFNKKFFDNRHIVGDHKPIAGLIITLINSLVFFLLYQKFIAFILPYAVFFGDLTGSFLKRRIGIKNGNPLPIIDQLNFFVASYLLVRFVGIIFPFSDFLILAVFTILVHWLSNIAAFRLKLKDVPW